MAQQKWQTLSQIFSPTHLTYAHTLLDQVPPENGQCPTCWRDYNTHDDDDNTEPVCQPIRLTSCDHVVGKHCFDRWRAVSGEKGICLLCRQPLLPFAAMTTTTTFDSLHWISRTRWFAWHDRLTASISVGRGPIPSERLKLQAGQSLTLWDLVKVAMGQLDGPFLLTTTLHSVLLGVKYMCKMMCKAGVAFFGSHLAPQFEDLRRFWDNVVLGLMGVVIGNIVVLTVVTVCIITACNRQVQRAAKAD